MGFWFLVSVVSATDCSWCEGGACDESAAVTKESFWTSISSSIGRGYPYWIPAGQARLNETMRGDGALIIHHGADRNGDEYTKYAAKTVPANWLVFGAQVYNPGDDGFDEAHDLFWDVNNGSDWRWCGPSSSELSVQISSCGVLDEMVDLLLAYVPRVIVAGHSAGGQIVQRNALLTPRAPDARVEYFVMNPSSVTYTSPLRPVAVESCCDNQTILDTTWDFALPPEGCAGYDTYGYGLNGTLVPYAGNVSESIANYKLRKVSYVSGESDVCDRTRCDACTNDGGLDTSCEAYAQGPCRMARLHAFAQFVEGPLVSVPRVGHNGCAMLQSPEFKAAAFPPSSGDPSYQWFCEGGTFCTDGTSTSNPTPGTVLMGGGTDVDSAFEWHAARADGGNFLVLRESGTDAYNKYIKRLARRRKCGGKGLDAVATLILNDKSAASDPFVLSRVANADAIFFAGGDQSKYVDRILDTPLDELLKDKSCKVTIGGTSAGNAIQGRYIYTGDDGSAVSDECLADPYNDDLGPGSLVGPLLAQAPLVAASVIMDDHFVTRDRMGRLVAFLGRLFQDSNATNPRGIGVDEVTALLVDQIGNLRAVGDGTAYACDAPTIDASLTCEPGTPLTLTGVRCHRLQAAAFDDCDDPEADLFDLATWSGTGVTYSFDVINGTLQGAAYGPSA